MSAKGGVIQVSSTQYRETSQAYKGVDGLEKYGNGFKPGRYKISISENGMGHPETVKRTDTLTRQRNEINVMLAELDVAKGMYQLNTAAEQLEIEGLKSVTAYNQKLIAVNEMEGSGIDLEVSNHNLEMKRIEAPLLKATANYRVEQIYENMLGTLGQLIKTRTDRAVTQWTLQQHGYDTSMLPEVPAQLNFPHKMDFQLPEFKRPEVITRSSQVTTEN
jgi:hypothetical protein